MTKSSDKSQQRSLLNAYRVVAACVLTLVVVNFATFAIIAGMVGGDALSGEVVDGKYFVSSHGKVTEVSEAFWNFSRYHAMSTGATWPLGVLCMLFLGLTAKPKTMPLMERMVLDPPRNTSLPPKPYDF